MREIEDLPGIKVSGRNINSLRHADDAVLIAISEAGLQNLLNIINETSESLGLGLNIKKTVTMVIFKKADTLISSKFEQPPSETSERLQIVGNVYLL